MIRLSPLCSAAITLGAALVTQAVSLALPDWTRDFPMIAAYLTIALVIASLCFVYLAWRGYASLAALLSGAARGQMENRAILVPYSGSIRSIALTTNNLLDRVEAFMRESMDMLEALNEGRYYRRISTVGLPGDFKVRAERINRNTDIIAQRIASFEAMTSTFDQEMHIIVQSLGTGARRLNEVTGTVSLSTAQTLDSTNNVAAAAEELSVSIHEISGHVTTTADNSRKIVAEAESTMASVTELADSAKAIAGLLAEIGTIAGQTNLLALNAAVEAARAGDQGRGFAVVAEEVKRLADQTGTITATIQSRIAQISITSANAVAAMGGIEVKIKDMSESTDAIANAIKNQSMATDEIGRRVHDTAAASGLVASAIGNAQDTDTDDQSIARLAKQLAADADHMESSLQSYLAAARSVTGNLREHALDH